MLGSITTPAVDLATESALSPPLTVTQNPAKYDFSSFMHGMYLVEEFYNKWVFYFFFPL